MPEEQLAIEFLQKLLDGSRGVIVLAEDAEGASWRVVTNEELQVLRPIIERPADATPPSLPLCYNLEDAAKAIGVSAHKLSGWLRRQHHPVPHIKDGRQPNALMDCLEGRATGTTITAGRPLRL